jgi:hypothetical protein
MMVEEYARLVHRLSLDLYKRLKLPLFINGWSTHGLPFKLEFIEGGKAAHFYYHNNPVLCQNPVRIENIDIKGRPSGQPFIFMTTMVVLRSADLGLD